jgi:hypothetical protein
MRFIAKISMLAIVAAVYVKADQAEAEARVNLAGAEAEEFEVVGGRDLFGRNGDFDLSFSDESSWGSSHEGRHRRRRHNRCHRCGSDPCRCKTHRHKHHHKTSSADVTETTNDGDLVITAPYNCDDKVDICSEQVLCWSLRNAEQQNFTTFLGYYVGGKACGKGDKKELAKHALNGCKGKVHDKNIFYLGSSNVKDGGYLQWNIPFCIPDGKYQPVLLAFDHQNPKKIRFMTAVGPWVTAKHNEGGPIQTNLVLQSKK